MAHDRALDRRTLLRSTGGVLAGAALAGCGGDGGGNGNGGGDGNTVSAVNYAFEPDEITIAVGETVTWEFESGGHNVCAYPEMFPDIVSIPESADPFGTMSADGSAYEPVDPGEVFEHTFETAGEYTYVCGPHVNQDMIGTVIVE